MLTWPHLAQELLGVVGWAVLLQELVARVGSGVLPWLVRSRQPPLQAWGTAFLIGLAAVGFLALGEALVGLLFMPVAVAGPAALAAASLLRRRPRGSLVLAAARDALATLGPTRVAAVAVAGLFLAGPLLTLNFNQDSYIYHLAVPSHFLAAHRALLDRVSLSFHFPLPAELMLTLPLALGDDRLACWMVASAFLAASAVFVSRCTAWGAREGGWLGIWLALGGLTAMPGLVTSSKNDVVAAAWFIAGALLGLARMRAAEAVFIGLSVCGKIAYAPLGALWLLRTARRRGGEGIALLSVAMLPLLPWLLKSWLATGNPLFGVLPMLAPSPAWTERNQAAFMNTVMGIWSAPTMAWPTLPGAWWGIATRDAPLLLLCLIALAAIPFPSMAGTSFRGLALLLLAAEFATLRMGHLSRYLLPAWWAVALLAALAASRLPGRTASVAVALLGGGALWGLLHASSGLPAIGRDLLRGRELVGMAGLSSYGQSAARLRDGTPGRLLLFGEARSYRLTGRVVYGGAAGETPLAWELAHASRSPGELRKKFRQLGASRLLYNFVSADWLALRYEPFVWDPRAMRIYVDFCRRYLVPRWRSETVDYVNGGFCLYDLARTPVRPVPPTTWFAPGTEMINAPGDRAKATGLAAVAGAYARTAAAWPEVDVFTSAWGYWTGEAGDRATAYRVLRPLVRRGYDDGLCVLAFGLAALELEHLDEAESAFRIILVRQPRLAGPILVDLTAIEIRRARAALAAGRPADAARHVDAADRWLAAGPAEATSAVRDSRALQTALLKKLRTACRAGGTGPVP